MRNIAVLGPLAVLAFTAAAQAADMPYDPPPVVEHRAAPVHTGGWYLRGDVGVGLASNGGWSNTDLVAANGRFVDDSMESWAMIGFGVGYKFNDWFRADITGEYRGSIGVTAVDIYDFDCTAGGLAGIGSCSGGGIIKRNNYWDGNISSTVFMVNGYVDIGNYYGFSPFVGVGVGAAYNYFSGLRDHDPSDLGGAGWADDNGKWNFAWALHGGLGYAVTDNLTLEASYRYMYLGEAESGAVVCASACGTTHASVKVEDIHSHDLRIGMRWMLGARSVPVYDDYPIVRKY
ncbi:MAG: porin family protein [Hyphomicrobiales bacterium]|nr:porin family protein [Hyphomicrobiales bacterium]